MQKNIHLQEEVERIQNFGFWTILAGEELIASKRKTSKDDVKRRQKGDTAMLPLLQEQSQNTVIETQTHQLMKQNKELSACNKKSITKNGKSFKTRLPVWWIWQSS